MIEDLLKFLKIKTERNNEGKNFELIEKLYFQNYILNPTFLILFLFMVYFLL